MIHPEAYLDFFVYEDGETLVGVAQVTLPDIAFMTASLTGAGVGGTVETPLAGMLEAMVRNAANVADDLTHHSPSFFDGNVTYFKPDQIPAGVTGDNRRYWEKMMEFEAGNYENYCDKSKLHIVHTPHEHDLMMDDASLEIIVPEIYKIIGR